MPDSESFWVMVQAIGTLIAAFGALAALIYLAKQAASMKASFEFDSKWRRKEKASELAILYSHEILPRISYCLNVLEELPIYQTLRRIDMYRMNRFNCQELAQLCPGQQDVSKAVRKELERLPEDVFLSGRLYVPAQYRHPIVEESSPSTRKSALVQEYWTILLVLLNDLEHFSLCLNTGIADGDVLYPSLHQTFFSTITGFYFAIAEPNGTARDKYFTHITKLFLTWRSTYEKHEAQECQMERSFSNTYDAIR